jgi:K+/H+ antiporter YhaU regulatory subunit KhtT
MTYLLTKASRQQHKQTNDIVKRIVRLTIETNTASTIVAIVSLILFFGTPNTTYFICPTMVLAKL